MSNLDISYRSMGLLEKACQQHLKSNIVIPDWGKSSIEFLADEQSKVVTMGLFYQRVFEIQYWPKGDFELFCLSNSVKKVLVNLLGFDKNSVQVLPRYKLFNINHSEHTYMLNPEIHFVYAGRISPQKNIEFLILINFHMQLLYSPSVKLTLMGNFDNDHHRNLLGIYEGDYKKKIENLINELPWPGEKPQIYSEYSENEWIKHFPQNGVFISVSNLISEDFSVSVAQLQEEVGCPLVLPYWGGFKDVRGSNVKFYQSELIASSNENLKDVSEKAKNFTINLINEKFNEPNQFKNRNDTVFSPIKINIDYLKNRISENKKRWGDELEFVCKGEFYKFANTNSGQIFFKEYVKLF